jgi:hypothetical protein
MARWVSPRAAAARATFTGSDKLSKDADVWQWRSTNARPTALRASIFAPALTMI